MPVLSIDPNLSIIEGLNPDSGATQFEGHVKRDRQLAYWKRCEIPGCMRHENSKGFIMLGPVFGRYTITEYYDFEKGKHATPLSLNYIAPNPNNPKLHVTDELTGNHKTRWIPLIRNGGVHEMPIEQMVEMNWHRNPKICAAIPALDKYLEADIPCDYGCPLSGRDARIFNDELSYQAHVKVVHSDVQAPRTIGKMLAEHNTPNPEFIAILQELVKLQKGGN